MPATCLKPQGRAPPDTWAPAGRLLHHGATGPPHPESGRPPHHTPHKPPASTPSVQPPGPTHGKPPCRRSYLLRLGRGGPSVLPPACRPQAAPLTLTLRVSPSPAPARPCGTPAVPLPGQHNAQQDCVGQERTPRLLTPLLPELPSCPAPAAATPGPLRPRQTPAPPLLAPAARAVCSPTAHPRAGPRSPAALARGSASLLRATGSHVRLPPTPPADPRLTHATPIGAFPGADGDADTAPPAPESAPSPVPASAAGPARTGLGWP